MSEYYNPDTILDFTYKNGLPRVGEMVPLGVVIESHPELADKLNRDGAVRVCGSQSVSFCGNCLRRSVKGCSQAILNS